VEGEDDIGIRGLASESGRAKSTLQDWSKERVEGRNWHEQRVHFKSRLGTATQQKIIEKTSDKLSDQLSDIVIANYERHKLFRDYAAKIAQTKAQQLAEIQNLPLAERAKILAKDHVGYEMNYWSQILKRSTDAIEAVTGLKYFVDINAAAGRLEKEGYEVIDPSNNEQSESD
jgi:hypothetical protein